MLPHKWSTKQKKKNKNELLGVVLMRLIFVQTARNQKDKTKYAAHYTSVQLR